MSFGFSVGDIIVVGKICYRQYTAATTGRKDASKELQELGNVLFSLNCALDHLSRTAKDVLARANSQPNPDDARETRIKLDRMINSCAETLKELDEATKKHRDTDANSQSGHASLATSVSAPGRLQKLRRSATTQWNKISWDLLSESLGSYRRKLEGHTAAINMVLLTFIWCVHPHADASLGQGRDRSDL